MTFELKNTVGFLSSLIALLSIPSALMAQDELDRPTQRWIPLPNTRPATPSAQTELMQMLQQLAQSRETESDNPFETPSAPKIDPEQLKRLEKIVQDWQKKFPDMGLQDVPKIPNDLLQQVVSDPEKREQAKQLLEAFAKSRSFPPPNNNSDANPSRSPSVPFPRARDDVTNNPDRSPSSHGTSSSLRSSPEKKSPEKNSSSRPSLEPPPTDDQGNHSSDPFNPKKSKSSDDPFQTDPSSEPGLNATSPIDASKNSSPSSNVLDSNPNDPFQSPNGKQKLDEQKLRALKELFQKLESIPPLTNDSRSTSRSSNARTTSPSASSTNPGTSSSSRLQDPTRTPSRTSRNSSALPKPNTIPSGQANRNSTSRPAPLDASSLSNNERTLPQNLPSSSSLQEESSDSSSLNNVESSTSSSTRSSSDELKNNATTKESNGRNLDADLDRIKNRLEEGLKEWDKLTQPAEPKNTSATKRAATANRDRGPSNTSSPSNNPSSQLDIKSEVERHGLGGALQRIVEKTLQEESNRSKKNTESLSKSKKVEATKDKSESSNLVPWDAMTKEGLGKRDPLGPPPEPPKPPSRSSLDSMSIQPRSPSSSNSSQSQPTPKWVQDLWASISEVPRAPTPNRSSASSSSSGGLSSLQLQWTWTQTLILLTACGVGLAIIFLARRRLQTVIQQTWNQTFGQPSPKIQDIQSREDVVKAFHALVHHTPSSIDLWWPHRKAAQYLRLSHPQLEEPLSQLAEAYEHCRYLPPDQDMPAERLQEIRAAYLQCNALAP